MVEGRLLPNKFFLTELSYNYSVLVDVVCVPPNSIYVTGDSSQIECVRDFTRECVREHGNVPLGVWREVSYGRYVKMFLETTTQTALHLAFSFRFLSIWSAVLWVAYAVYTLSF